jgi:hypothetical protein
MLSQIYEKESNECLEETPQTDEGAWSRIAFEGGAFESSTAWLNLKSI